MERKVLKSIRSLHKNIKDSFYEDKNIHKNINFTQYQIIMYLLKHENEEVCQKDLEAETHLNKASITASIDSLEDKEIVKRMQSPIDKRKNIITLTAKAKEKQKELEQRADELERQVLLGIDSKDLERFFVVIDKINDNLKRRD